MAFSKPSPHRCKILSVSRLLSKEDVNEILYLSEDFIPQSEVGQISSGLDLMRSLERHNRVAPGKYSYLLACLKEIGRIDLVTTLTEFIYSCLLESMPASFRVPNQLYAAKLQILMNKQSRYVEGMKNLQAAAGNLHLWEEWLSSTLFNLLRCTLNGVSILPENVDVPGLLHIILEGVASVSVPWIVTVAAFLQDTHNTDVGRKLKDIELQKTKVFGNLSCAGLHELFLWKERPQHLHLAVSEASCALFEFLSELLGKAADNERVRELLKSLSDIKSITPESYGFETLTQLLFLVTKVAVSASIQCHSCDPLLKSLLHQLKNVINCNNSQILAVFQGTNLATKFSKVEFSALNSTYAESSFLVCLPKMDACPFIITMLVCLLALLSVSELTPIHWQQIELHLLEYLKSQQQGALNFLKCLMPQVCGAMQCELDNFRDTSLTELMNIIPGENNHFQDLIASVLHY